MHGNISKYVHQSMSILIQFYISLQGLIIVRTCNNNVYKYNVSDVFTIFYAKSDVQFMQIVCSIMQNVCSVVQCSIVQNICLIVHSVNPIVQRPNEILPDEILINFNKNT